MNKEEIISTVGKVKIEYRRVEYWMVGGRSSVKTRRISIEMGLRLSNKRGSRKLIIKNAKIMHDEMTKKSKESDSNVNFLDSTGWLRNFKERNGLLIS